MCTIVETRGGTDTHSFFTHAVAQTYWHICIHAICQYLRIQYANICTCNMQISAHAICKYLHMQYANICKCNTMHITPLTGMQLKSTDPTSSLWARVPQLKGFVKLLFSNTPGAFGYKKHGAWLTQVSLNFSRHFFGVPWNVCNCCVFWPHISHLTYMIVGSI